MYSGLMLTGLVSLVAQILLFLVWLAGIVFAVVRWRRHPRASLLIVIGLVVAMANQAAGLALSLSLPQLIDAQFFPSRSLPMIVAAVGWVRSLVSAVAFGLLLAAVFVERPPEDAADTE